MTAKKKLRGRPQQATKRVKKIDARFTEEEYQLILELEKTLGITKTELVRIRVLQQAKAIVVNAKDVITQLDLISAELGKAGSNINQLAKYANILQKKSIHSPVVTERFNLLMENHNLLQQALVMALRQVIRQLGR